jgi:hypothetical protein
MSATPRCGAISAAPEIGTSVTSRPMRSKYARQVREHRGDARAGGHIGQRAMPLSSRAATARRQRPKPRSSSVCSGRPLSATRSPPVMPRSRRRPPRTRGCRAHSRTAREIAAERRLQRAVAHVELEPGALQQSRAPSARRPLFGSAMRIIPHSSRVHGHKKSRGPSRWTGRGGMHSATCCYALHASLATRRAVMMNVMAMQHAVFVMACKLAGRHRCQRRLARSVARKRRRVSSAQKRGDHGGAFDEADVAAALVTTRCRGSGSARRRRAGKRSAGRNGSSAACSSRWARGCRQVARELQRA